MNIILEKAPKLKEIVLEMELWYEKLWNAVTPECSQSGDAAATIPSGSNLHSVTTLTSARQLSLPDAARLKDGQSIVVQDESGAAGTYTISIVAAGTDTISGATTITSNYGRRTVIKRGKGKWYSQ